MSKVEKQFEGIAKEYIAVEGDEELSRYELKVNWPSIKKMLPNPPAKILDYGCGGGTYSLIMANGGYDVMATDIAPSMVGHLKNTDIRAKLWDYKAKPLDEKFDAIVAKLVVQFVENLPAFAKAMREHIKQGGRLIISVPNPEKSRVEVEKSNVYPKEIGISGLVVDMIHRELDDYQGVFEGAGFKLKATDEPINPSDPPQEMPRRLNMLFEAA